MFQVKVDANNLRKNFGDAQQRFLEGLQSGLNEGALVIEKAAKEKAPEETGDLRQSIQSEVEMQGSKGTAKVYTNNQYAIYVHEGTGIHSRTGMGRKEVPWTYKDDKTGMFVRTSGMHATPFMEEAATENRSQVVQIVREEIEARMGG